jgi:hypothetical protein
MQGICRLLLPLLTLVPPAAAGIVVHESQGRIDVAAAAAPLADVLDGLARKTGMKVVYEGPAPRQLVTLSLVGRSPAEAVTAILEGQGLNYALVLDATATRVERLLVTGNTSSVTGSTAARPVPPSRGQPRFIRPEPEPDEPPDDEAPSIEMASPQEPDPAQPQPPAPDGQKGPPLPPGMPAVPPGVVVGVPPTGFPTPPPPPPNWSLTPVIPAAPAPQPTPAPP